MPCTNRKLSVMIPLLLVSFASHAGGPFVGKLLPEPYINRPIAEGATAWYCAYVGNTIIRCLLADAGDRSASSETIPQHSLETLGKQIVEIPQSLAGQVIEIPLRAPPFGFDLAGQLAESVVCGRRKDCGIVFGESPSQLVLAVQKHQTTRLIRRIATN